MTKSTILNECKLCLKTAKLQKSHIIPRSIIRRVKESDIQILAVSTEPNPSAIRTNGDQIQHLLCKECEALLSSKYENYGTQLFIKENYIVENDEYVLILNFKYETYFLFLLSMIWRASVSTRNDFKELKPLSKAEKVFRECLLSNNLKATSDTDLRLDDFIRVEVSRITDPTNRIPQDALNKIMCSFGIEKTEGNQGIHCFLAFDGYFISIKLFTPCKDHTSKWHHIGNLKNRRHLKIPKIPYQNIHHFYKGIVSIAQSTSDTLASDI